MLNSARKKMMSARPGRALAGANEMPWRLRNSGPPAAATRARPNDLKLKHEVAFVSKPLGNFIEESTQ
jgi:hypothetical protein